MALARVAVDHLARAMADERLGCVGPAGVHVLQARAVKAARSSTGGGLCICEACGVEVYVPPVVVLERFAIFAGADYYPNPGLDDYIGTIETTVEIAEKRAQQLLLTDELLDWATVVRVRSDGALEEVTSYNGVGVRAEAEARALGWEMTGPRDVAGHVEWTDGR